MFIHIQTLFTIHFRLTTIKHILSMDMQEQNTLFLGQITQATIFMFQQEIAHLTTQAILLQRLIAVSHLRRLLQDMFTSRQETQAPIQKAIL